MNKLMIYIISILLSISSFTYAQTYYVSTTGSNTSGNGTQNNPWRTITFALTQVDTLTNQTKTIFVNSGTYSRATNGEEFPLNLVNNLLLLGAVAGNTILDASINEFEGVNRRVINCINVSSVKIENFTVTGGIAFLDSLGNYPIGGGLYISNSDNIKITNNIITENQATDGTGYGADAGGIAVETSNRILITDNEVSNNLSIGDGCNGGGIYVRSSRVLIRDNIIKENNTWGLFGSAGGGISVWNWEDTTYIVNNTVISNEASVLGGGIYFSSRGIIARNTINENIVGAESFQIGNGGGLVVNYQPCIVGGGIKNANNIFANIGEINNPVGTQMIAYSLDDPIDARFNFFGSNTDPNDTTQIYGKLFIEPFANNFIVPDTSNLIIAPSPIVIDTNLMSGTYKQKIGFYNVSKSLTDAIEILSITSKNGLVDISKSNFLINAISEDSVGFTFNVDEILLNKDTINISTSEGDFLITFFILGNDSITAIEQKSIEAPTQFELFQNFPNPFNPVTSIKFTIIADGFAELKVYDILGKEVATLINKEIRAGSYTFNFNAQNLASGIYFYRLSTNNYNAVRKMILLR